MTTHSSEQLLELVQTLEHISSQLNDILEQEQTVLKAQDSQQLTILSVKKKSLVSALENHTKTVHIFLHNMNVKKGLYGLSNLISEIKSETEKQLLSTSWLRTQTLSEANKKINEVNGSIIELNRRHTQRSLDVLRGQVGATSSTYGADGHAMKNKISRNISIV
ncbi:MAG: flagellar biosynthesis protein FlgN [Cycloclasticus sp. symbiont of Bathymodiolus heckerae]|nr:MAG: flagellar biosynthesis protein FlgN [Cycloclasticus sp. symbiont of Bathymodiolus heckerae]